MAIPGPPAHVYNGLRWQDIVGCWQLPLQSCGGFVFWNDCQHVVAVAVLCPASLFEVVFANNMTGASTGARAFLVLG